MSAPLATLHCELSMQITTEMRCQRMNEWNLTKTGKPKTEETKAAGGNKPK